MRSLENTGHFDSEMKELDARVAKLHLPPLGAELMVVTQEQPDCIRVKVEGPFKVGHHHYRAVSLSPELRRRRLSTIALLTELVAQQFFVRALAGIVPHSRSSRGEVAGSLFLGSKKQRAVDIVTDAWLATAGLWGG